MKKAMTIRTLSLMLVVFLMATALVGCAQEPAPVDPAPAVTDSPVVDESVIEDEPAELPVDTPADEPVEAPAEEPAEEPVEESAELVNFSAYGYDYLVPQAAIDGVALPLVEEPTTLTVFRQWSSSYLSDLHENYAIQEIANRTGVNVEYTCVSATEQFQIMYASQDYTDMIKATANSYRGSVDMAIEDEIYLDAADLMQWMPVWSGWLQTDAEYLRDCKTDDGAYYMNSIQSGKEPAWCGALVRGDWLDDCGLDAPVTFDDWHEMLTVFKEQKGATRAMCLSATGYDSQSFALTAGYGVAPEWYQVDGEVHYGMVEDGMKQYLAMMSQWYAEGLVNPDFTTFDLIRDSANYYINGETGAWDSCAYMVIDLYPKLAGGQGYLVPVSNPVVNEGDPMTKLRRDNAISGGNCFFVTTAAEERGVTELCARWIDYHYTVDCAYIMTFGEENVDWAYGEDGLPHISELVITHPEKTAYQEQKSMRPNSSYYIWWNEFDQKSEAAMNAYDFWHNSATADYVFPTGVTLTAEESEDVSSAYNDVQTYANEYVLGVIVGERSLDEWDSYVEELYTFGLQEVIDTYQDALNRYYAR